MKYLGKKIDKTLSGEGTLDIIVKKCTGKINFLYRQAACLLKVVKRTLCHLLVQCHLDYAVSSWYTALTQKAKRKLQILQNKMVRFILDLAKRTHLTVDYMKELNLLRVSDTAQQLRLNNEHKIFYHHANGYLQENLLRPGTDYSTREAASGTLMCLMSRELRAIHFILTQLRIGIVYQIT